jgi:hypothetical protein
MFQVTENENENDRLQLYIIKSLYKIANARKHIFLKYLLNY